MREIKFRAWDKRSKKWLHPACFRISGYGEVFYNMIEGPNIEGDYQVEINQSTGLKDKNGKEIYEGDIVDGMARRYFIKNSGRGMYEFWETETEQGYHWGIWNIHEQLEVIGNIYENPELMKSL